MFIAEFTIDHPVLGESLHRVPDIEVEWQETYSRSDGRTQMIFWLTTEDFESARAAIDDSLEVGDLTVFTQVENRRLCRVEFTESGQETNLMDVFIEFGGVLLSATGTSEGWRCRARFPNREAYQPIYRFCRTHDIDFRFDRIYERTAGDPGSESTLTEAQRETLIEAVDSGYLDIPRKCSLEELGERLGISQSAASERFRRAVKKLVVDSI